MGVRLGKSHQIDERNRVVIPKELMKLMKLKQGDEVSFEVENNKTISVKFGAYRILKETVKKIEEIKN